MDKQTKKLIIPARVKRDARSVFGGIYRWNATYAVGYAFNFNEKEVTNGEFVSPYEVERVREEYEAFYDFGTKRFTVNV